MRSICCRVTPERSLTRRELSIPVMVHTGMGVPFADPVRLTPLARDYSDVRIRDRTCPVPTFFPVQAMLLAQAFDNVWLEPKRASA